MKKILCLAATLSLCTILVSAQTPSPTPTPVPSAAATAHPNLTGTWNLNLSKSDFDQIPPPVSETLVFTQTGSRFTIEVISDSDRGKENYTLAFPIDGTDTPTPKDTIPATAELQILSSKGEWQGMSFVFTEKITYQGNPGTLISTFTLSPDGKTLTRVMHISVDQGDFNTTSVFEKQPANASNPV